MPPEPPDVPHASPTEESTDHAQVAEQVRRLDAFVRGRLDALEQAQQDHDAREQQLVAREQAVAKATAAFADQLAQAQALSQQLEDTGAQAQRHLAASAQPLADRLEQVKRLDRAVEQRMARMQQMHKQSGEAVDKFLLRALRDTKEEAADLIAPIKQELDEHLAKQTAAMERKVQEKIAELDVDIEDALAPLTRRFDEAMADAQRQADALAGALPGRVEQELSKLEADTAKRIRQIAAVAQTAGERIGASLAKAHETARQQADQGALTHATRQVPAAPTTPVVETPPLDSPLKALAQRLKQTPAGTQQQTG